MKTLRYNLKSILDETEISGYRIAQESGIRGNTIADIVNNEAKQVKLENLTKILNVINTLQDERHYSIDDIIVYNDDDEH